MSAKEDAKGYFMGSLSQEGFKKRETAAEENMSRDEIKLNNWPLRMRGRRKQKSRNSSPKTGRSLADEPRTSRHRMI